MVMMVGFVGGGGGRFCGFFFAMVAVGFCCSGSEFETKREIGRGGCFFFFFFNGDSWVFLLFIYGGGVLSNTKMVRK